MKRIQPKPKVARVQPPNLWGCLCCGNVVRTESAAPLMQLFDNRVKGYNFVPGVWCILCERPMERAFL